MGTSTLINPFVFLPNTALKQEVMTKSKVASILGNLHP